MRLLHLSTVTLAAAAFVGTAGTALAVDKFRTSGGGYATAGTWVRYDSTLDPPAWVNTSKPTSTDNAYFDIAANGGGHGTYTVTFAQSETCNRIGVYNDNVTLSIGSGRVFTAGPDFSYIGLSGPGNSASLRVTSGELNISNNLYVDRPTSLTLSGASARLIVPSSTIFVGGFASNNPVINNALLRVENAGRVESTNIYSSAQEPYRGDILVTGSGSRIVITHPTLSAALQVGAGWTSISRIELGGRIDSDYGTVGFSNGANGDMTVTDPGSQWNCPKNLNVGRNSGSSGALRIQNGGSVTIGTSPATSAQMWIGEFEGSTGTVEVSGSGSLFTTHGYLDVGASGHGTLSVTNGGRVDTRTTGIIAWGTRAANAPEDLATITGTGSRWDIGTSLEVGRLGRGRLEVLDGGVVTSATFVAAQFVGGQAAIHVDGGSTIDVAGAATLGGMNVTAGGPATLSVGPTGTFEANTLQINPLGTLSGSGVVAANVSSAGTVSPGENGAGTLSITGSFAQIATVFSPNDGAGGLRMDLLGPSANQHDRVIVSGTVTLAGGMVLLRPQAFEPPVGFTTELVRGSSISGMFDVVFGSPGPNKFYRFTKVQNPDNTQSLMLSVENLRTIIGLAPTGPTALPGLPNRAAAGDFNADGYPDLAVIVPRDTSAPGDTGAILVLFNNGQWNGTGKAWADPSAGTTYFLGAEPVAIRIADMNAATGPDVVVAARAITPTPAPGQEYGVRLLLNNGTGTLIRQGFPGETVIDIGHDPRGLAVANFDNDPDDTPDIACTSFDNFSNGQVVIRPQGPISTSPTFLPPRVVPVFGVPGAVEPGGLDNPKDQNDLCVALPGTQAAPDGRVLILLSGPGSGPTWDGPSEAGEVRVGKRPGHIVLGDLNADGALDAVTTNFDDGTISILLNAQSGGSVPIFLSTQSGTLGPQPGAVTLVDLDRDGDLDLAAVTREDTGDQTVVRILRNDLNITLPPEERPVVLAPDRLVAQGESPVFVLNADVDQDGDRDLVTINANESISTGSAKAYLSTCVADINNNGVVNTADLAGFLGDFGTIVPPFTNGDANGDGVISTPDLVYFLGRFGGSGC